MIVNYTAAGWEIITQRAHGLLAAQLAAQWRHSIRSERWLETLTAIAEHDDAQIELERNDLLTPQGGPLNFTMKTFDLEHCERTMDFALSKSRYIALLCSMHLSFVYGDAAQQDAKAAKFMRRQKELQKEWCGALKLTKNEAANHYRLLEWCDALSLLLCQHENQPEARSVEISNGPDLKKYELIQSDKNILTVAPWPFEDATFEVYYETRLIPQLAFKTAAEFRSAFQQAAVIEKRWTFKKEKAA